MLQMCPTPDGEAENMTEQSKVTVTGFETVLSGLEHTDSDCPIATGVSFEPSKKFGMLTSGSCKRE